MVVYVGNYRPSSQDGIPKLDKSAVQHNCPVTKVSAFIRSRCASSPGVGSPHESRLSSGRIPVRALPHRTQSLKCVMLEYFSVLFGKSLDSRGAIGRYAALRGLIVSRAKLRPRARFRSLFELREHDTT